MKLILLILATLLGAHCGLTRADSATPSSATFASALTAALPAWDADRDGALSTGEIDTALADANIEGDAAAALAVMKRLARGKTWQNIPRTLEHLTALAAGGPSQDEPDLRAMFADAQKRIAGTVRELFAQGGPSLQSLHQGKMGNCFSLAPLGAMLHRDARQVRAMFREPGDGAFEVQIGARWVRVAAPTDAEIALSSSSESTGLWANVYEKAAGLARNELREPKDRAATPLDAIARGGSAGTMLAFITGHEMERFTLKWAKDADLPAAERETKLQELRDKLTAAFASARCVTTGTLKPTLPGVRGGHAFCILGYEAARDTIRVWDPHGDAFTPKGEPGPQNGYPRDADGIAEYPLHVFAAQFSGLAFELIPTALQGEVAAFGGERLKTSAAPSDVPGDLVSRILARPDPGTFFHRYIFGLQRHAAELLTAEQTTGLKAIIGQHSPIGQRWHDERNALRCKFNEAMWRSAAAPEADAAKLRAELAGWMHLRMTWTWHEQFAADDFNRAVWQLLDAEQQRKLLAGEWKRYAKLDTGHTRANATGKIITRALGPPDRAEAFAQGVAAWERERAPLHQALQAAEDTARRAGFAMDLHSPALLRALIEKANTAYATLYLAEADAMRRLVQAGYTDPPARCAQATADAWAEAPKRFSAAAAELIALLQEP